MANHYVNGVPFLNTESRSVIDALEDERIVYFSQEGDALMATECCDGYFMRRLSKAQVGALIGELQAIYERM